MYIRQTHSAATLLSMALACCLSLTACGGGKSPEKETGATVTPSPAQPSTTPSAAPSADEAKEIARDAYVYGVPMVDTYKTVYAFNVDKGNPQYKGPFNSILNIARVFTPEDTAFVTPNSDTP